MISIRYFDHKFILLILLVFITSDCYTILLVLVSLLFVFLLAFYIILLQLYLLPDIFLLILLTMFFKVMNDGLEFILFYFLVVLI